ncbi:MAG: asparagine synthetase B, partial [Acidobacteriota bacterium]
MCGIGGFWGRFSGEKSREILHTLDRMLHHRGPDEGGHHLESGAALLIRRLKIIDLVTGSQPMASENGDIITVFNGEIYNHQDLRRGLTARGHTFRSQSDTEVIVH